MDDLFKHFKAAGVKGFFVKDLGQTFLEGPQDV